MLFWVAFSIAVQLVTSSPSPSKLLSVRSKQESRAQRRSATVGIDLLDGHQSKFQAHGPQHVLFLVYLEGHDGRSSQLLMCIRQRDATMADADSSRTCHLHNLRVSDFAVPFQHFGPHPATPTLTTISLSARTQHIRRHDLRASDRHRRRRSRLLCTRPPVSSNNASHPTTISTTKSRARGNEDR